MLNLLRAARQGQNQYKSLFSKGVAAGVGAASLIGGVAYADDALHAPEMPWSHHGHFSAYDTASLRRGYEVYRQVCSTCHSMEFMAFRNLVGTTHTEEQAKMIAVNTEITDGPNEEGEMFTREGKLADAFPAPYENDEKARFINGGALPVDLSCVSKARHQGEDYVFSLLSGYREPPAGVSIREGLYYNPYFPGGAIAMPPPLMRDSTEYEDDTEASISQQAKDVATFLAFVSEPEADARKKMGVKAMITIGAALLITGYYKRWKWNVLKTRRISYLTKI
jgi:ubiquinol-cytochrome c reductase cytochrome c1 subunit